MKKLNITFIITNTYLLLFFFPTFWFLTLYYLFPRFRLNSIKNIQIDTFNFFKTSSFLIHIFNPLTLFAWAVYVRKQHNEKTAR